MPSTSLQSRIHAFEALATPSSSSTAPLPKLTMKLAQKPTQNVLDTPISPRVASFSPIEPFTAPKASSSRSPSPSPPNLGRKTSLIDLKDWVVDDGPSLPAGRENSFGNGKPGGYKEYRRTPTYRAFPGNTSPSNSNAPLINLESPPKPKTEKAPPLPPRKPSYTSLKSASSSNSGGTHGGSSSGATLRPPSRSDPLTIDHSYPPLSKLNISDARKGPGHVPASSVSSFHSVSLSSDGGTDAGSVNNFIPMDRDDGEADSLDESFENVSTPAISPTNPSLTFDWKGATAMRKSAPPLPQRPSSSKPPPKSPSIHTPPSSAPTSHPGSPRVRSTLSASTSSSSSSGTARRVPPPPPPLSGAPVAYRSASGPPSSRTSLTSASASDRSSIISTTSRSSISTRASAQLTNKNLALLRTAPVPLAAAKRYEKVFVGNVLWRRKVEKAKANVKPALLSPGTRRRQADGWRGLSVDLITNPEDNITPAENKETKEDEEGDTVGADERLDAQTVKSIWSSSNLGKEKLRAIWNECDPSSRGSLDRDAFLKGMWRIDEELRRARQSVSSATNTPFRKHPPPPKKPSSPKLILR